MLSATTDDRYAIIPMEVLADDRLTSLAVRVYGAVAAHANKAKGWRAWPSVETIAEIVSRGLRQVREALRLLVDCGWLVVCGRRHGRYEWQLSATPSGEKPPLAEADTSISEQTKEQTPAEAADETPSEQHFQEPETRVHDAKMTATRRTVPPDQLPLLPIETEAPKPTARDLVAAWVDGYHEQRSEKPHPTTMRRVAGQCGRLGKDCTTIEDWRRAWRACRVAGRAGKVDPAPFLVDEQPRSLYAVPRARDLAAAAASTENRFLKALGR